MQKTRLKLDLIFQGGALFFLRNILFLYTFYFKMIDLNQRYE